jgi:hypothetical protein
VRDRRELQSVASYLLCYTLATHVVSEQSESHPAPKALKVVPPRPDSTSFLLEMNKREGEVLTVYKCIPTQYHVDSIVLRCACYLDMSYALPGHKSLKLFLDLLWHVSEALFDLRTKTVEWRCQILWDKANGYSRSYRHQLLIIGLTLGDVIRGELEMGEP